MDVEPSATQKKAVSGDEVAHRDFVAPLVPINEQARIYELLASEIKGSAVGWPEDNLARLEAALLERYGPAIGGRRSVRKLVRLASRPSAA